MKNLFETIQDLNYNNMILLEYYYDDVNDTLINESFKSELLSNLAKEIYKAEEEHRERDKREVERYKQQGYFSSPTKSEQSFASIFGPITKTGKYGGAHSGIQGLKWSEITDSDFELATGDDIAKKLKPIYQKKFKADCIVCNPGTKTPVMFIKAYGESDKPVIYTLNSNAKWKTGVQPISAQAYKYQERDLKYDEVVDVVDGKDVYILKITDDMIKDYKDLNVEREQLKKGMINYDKASLSRMLKAQQARYKTLVSEMKAKKLQDNPQKLFDDIKKVNDEVVQLYQDIIANPENLNEYFDLGHLMSYVSYAYESFYKSMKYKNKYDKIVAKVQKERGASPEDAKKWGSWEEESAKNEINDAKEYITKIKKEIQELRTKVK